MNMRQDRYISYHKFLKRNKTNTRRQKAKKVMEGLSSNDRIY